MRKNREKSFGFLQMVFTRQSKWVYLRWPLLFNEKKEEEEKFAKGEESPLESLH